MLSRLYTLLLVLLVAWSSWAVFGLLSVIVCPLVFMYVLLLSDSSWAYLLIALLFGIIVVALLVPAVSAAREPARRMQCANQLKQIALGLLCYEQANKCFPPAYIADKNGKPMHSWRVLILPFIEYDSLHRQYDFNEPWDGPNNRKLLAARPRVFACPSDQQAYARDAACTSYVAVVGANAAWPGAKPRRFGDTGFADANFGGNTSSNTIMLVEVADAGINWMEPKDFDVDTLESAISAPVGVKVSSKHMQSNGFFFCDTATAEVALGDGNVKTISSGRFTSAKLKSLLTVGGFKQRTIKATSGNEKLQINWPNCIALAVWLISVSLLLIQAVRSREPRQTGAVEDAAS